MAGVSTFNPASVFSPDREDTVSEREAVASIDKDFHEEDTLLPSDALGHAGIKKEQGNHQSFH